MVESSSGALRLFIAVLAPPAVRVAAEAAQKALRPTCPGVRWMALEGVHVTLQFLGATDRERVPALAASLAQVAADARPLRLRTDGLGTFPRSALRTRVVWLGLAGEVERLAILQASVVAATGRLGFAAEERPFAPHLTLGRVRNEADPREREEIVHSIQRRARPPAVEWPVNDLALMLSILGRQGATYRPLGRWRLGSGEELDRAEAE